MKKNVSVLLAILLLFSLSTFAYAQGAIYIGSAGQENNKIPQLVAHRGLSAIAPENTLAAFDFAGKMQFKHIEFDIYPTSDGKWVVMHDEDVDRMTNKSGIISEMTFSEIQECVITAGNRLNSFETQRIPTLEQTLEVCDKYNAVPVIEIKGGTGEDMVQLAELISGYKNHDKFIIISFSAELLCQMKTLLPELTMLLLIHDVTEEDIEFCLENNIDGIDFNYYVTDHGMTEKIISSDLIAGAWTVDSEYDYRQLCAMGVDFITTNSMINMKNTCDHICHSSNPFLRFFWKVIKFFSGRSRGQQYCTCYMEH